jgi:hypothetical protein
MSPSFVKGVREFLPKAAAVTFYFPVPWKITGSQCSTCVDSGLGVQHREP